MQRNGASQCSSISSSLIHLLPQSCSVVYECDTHLEGRTALFGLQYLENMVYVFEQRIRETKMQHENKRHFIFKSRVFY